MTMRKSFLNLGLGVVGGCLAFVAIDTIRGESAAPVSQLEIASPVAVRPVSLASNTALPVGGAGSVDLKMCIRDSFCTAHFFRVCCRNHGNSGARGLKTSFTHVRGPSKSEMCIRDRTW